MQHHILEEVFRPVVNFVGFNIVMCIGSTTYNATDNPVTGTFHINLILEYRRLNINFSEAI
jgi:hypothetical protein